MKITLLLSSLLAIAAATAAGQITVETALSSNLFEPYGMATDSGGNVFIADSAHFRIVKWAEDGQVSSLAGQAGSPGFANGPGNVARFASVNGLVLTRGGMVVSDTENQLIRFVSKDGLVVSNLAGTVAIVGANNGPAEQATFAYPLGLAADALGTIYIADSKNNAIRQIDTANQVTTLLTAADGLYEPAGVATDDNGGLWIANTRRNTIAYLPGSFETNFVVTSVATPASVLTNLTVGSLTATTVVATANSLITNHVSTNVTVLATNSGASSGSCLDQRDTDHCERREQRHSHLVDRRRNHSSPLFFSHPPHNHPPRPFATYHRGRSQRPGGFGRFSLCKFRHLPFAARLALGGH